MGSMQWFWENYEHMEGEMLVSGCHMLTPVNLKIFLLISSNLLFFFLMLLLLLLFELIERQIFSLNFCEIS